MPIITVEMFEGRTRKQRADFAKEVTKAAVKILKAPLDHTWVVFKEHPKSYWAMGGKLCDE
jgi:4-oxalocrotonate tautomerase